jgi:hypothetical protein
MNSNYHEQETIILSSKIHLPRLTLHKWLKKNGYKSEDDFYYLEYKGKAMPWQGNTLLTVDVLLDDSDIYETEEDIDEGISSVWNKLKVSYLMATRPRCCISSVIARISELKEEFSLQIEFNSSNQTISSLADELNKIADELEAWGGAGSETLAIMIQLQYQK